MRGGGGDRRRGRRGRGLAGLGALQDDAEGAGQGGGGGLPAWPRGGGLPNLMPTACNGPTTRQKKACFVRAMHAFMLCCNCQGRKLAQDHVLTERNLELMLTSAHPILKACCGWRHARTPYGNMQCEARPCTNMACITCPGRRMPVCHQQHGRTDCCNIHRYLHTYTYMADACRPVALSAHCYSMCACMHACIPTAHLGRWRCGKLDAPLGCQARVFSLHLQACTHVRMAKIGFVIAGRQAAS